LKVRGEKQSVTNSGKLFHARAPATAKARSPSDERRVVGTTRADDDADRSRRVTTRRYPMRNLFTPVTPSFHSSVPFHTITTWDVVASNVEWF